MKKILAGAIALLVIAVLLAPFINGLVLAAIISRYKDNLNEMYADTGSDVRVEILDYNRNFSSSVIDWRIDLGSLAAVYGIDEIILKDRARHGFTGIVSTTSLAKNPWFTDLVDNKLNGTNPLTITTAYSLSGKIESVIDLAAVSIETAQGTMDFRPGRIVTNVDRELNHLVSEAHWDGLSLPKAIQIDGFELRYDLEKISTYIWAGDLACTIDKIRIQDQGNEVALANFSGEYNLAYDRKSNRLSAGGSVAIANLLTQGEKVTDTLLKLEMNNMDAQGYEEFMTVYTGTMYSLLDQIREAADDPARMEEIMQQQMPAAGLQFAAAYEKLLKKDLEIKITDLRARLPQGQISGDLQLRLNRDLTFAQLAPLIMQPKLALDAFSLESDLRFPAELAGENPSLVAPIYPGMQTGLFVLNGSDLVHRARTKDGKLFLNGTEVLFD